MNKLFDDILIHLLDVTDSKYGFIGEVLFRDDGRPYLKTHTIGNITWDEESKTFYTQNSPAGIEFHKLDTPFGKLLTSAAAVISNNIEEDPLGGELPAGHPPLKSFLGIPLMVDDNMVGALGVANRPGGYDDEYLEEVGSLVHTIAQVVHSDRYKQHLEAVQSELKKEQSFISAVMDKANALIMVLDQEGRIIRTNRMIEDLSGYSARELEGQYVWDRLAAGEEADSGRKVYDQLKQTSEPNQHEMVWQCKDGRFRLISLSNSVIADVNDNARYIVSIGADITERRHLESMKDSFVSTVSHELRTPLTAIRGSLALLREGICGKLPEQTKPLLDISSSNVERLLLLINDLLDLAQVESGRLEYNMEPVEMISFMEDAVKINEPYGSQYQTEFVFDSDLTEAWVYGDKHRLMQVMSNLLSNAAKFSSGSPVVKVGVGETNDSVVIKVRDYGIGIPDDFKPLAFEKFTQADGSDSRQIGGSGLGLSIVKAIVNEHEGEINFDSTPGEGTEFTVAFPVYRDS